MVAAFNPTTYVLEGMRSVLIDGWQPDEIAYGFAAALGLTAVMTAWAVRVARRVTSRG